MFLGRIGSLNALEKTRNSRDWKKLLDGKELPSADTLGRVAAMVSAVALRQILVKLQRKMRQKKALPKLTDHLVALVFDGHESMSSFLRKPCGGCLERKVGKPEEERTQSYHRFVFASLVGEDFHYFVDVEPIRPGEGEVVAARRLYDRIHPLYAHSYHVVAGDALYLEGPFFQDAIDRGKDVIAVLKREDLRLFKDAEALFAETQPVTFRRKGRDHRCWDLSGFTSFPTVDRPLRVVKSIETWSVKRQRTGEMEEMKSRWIWATTIREERADTREIVRLGHSRWDIENQGFNEAANRYQINHVYRHDPEAMVVMFLLAMLAMNLFEVFFRRSLKPALRERLDRSSIAQMVRAVLCPKERHSAVDTT